MHGAGTTGQAGTLCLDAGSGGNTADGSDVRFAPAALAARSGRSQAYCNASAPSWGGAVIKINGIYHMWVLTMRNCSDPNDPNRGNPFTDTGQIDHATSTSPLGPFSCVQEDVIPHAKGFVGNPQIFRELAGRKRLLLAVIGTSTSVFVATGPDGPWVGTSVGNYNNPTLVPRPDGGIVLYNDFDIILDHLDCFELDLRGHTQV